ncbi:hypothetical protein F2Q69_00021787 [Brassica cretica]|uniref:Uncharacterized protein n=1 Tax=Brassica cretica TaxID=69181 RepID=A0A8S9Q650_BRACR|nr:hypothetical protein F2Q69_00021787 [Brassica cretica]
MATGLLTPRVALWRPIQYESGSPYGDRLATNYGRHMATKMVRTQVAIWRPGRCPSLSPYGDTTGPSQHFALSSRLHRFLLRASVTLSLVSSRSELPLEFYEKHRQDLFFSYRFKLTPLLSQ